MRSGPVSVRPARWLVQIPVTRQRSASPIQRRRHSHQQGVTVDIFGQLGGGQGLLPQVGGVFRNQAGISCPRSGRGVRRRLTRHCRRCRAVYLQRLHLRRGE